MPDGANRVQNHREKICIRYESSVAFPLSNSEHPNATVYVRQAKAHDLDLAYVLQELGKVEPKTTTWHHEPP